MIKPSIGLPEVGDLVLWRGRTTLVLVVAVEGGLVTTAGRPGVGALSDDPRRIRFRLRQSAVPPAVLGAWTTSPPKSA